MIKFLADWLVYQIFSLSPETRLGQAANFFVYDTIKIFFLLSLIIFLISIIRSFFPQRRLRKFLAEKQSLLEIS